MRNHSLQSGFFLIEVVVASAVIATVLIYLLGAINDSVEISQRALERTQASYLLEESAEAVKAIRDQDFATINALTLGSTYYMQWNGSTWVLTATPQTVGIFTRSIVFSSVARDGSSDIVASGGTIDAGTKKVVTTLTWTSPTGVKTETLSFYITNLRS